MTSRLVLSFASLGLLAWAQACSGSVIGAGNDGGEGGDGTTKPSTTRAASQNAAVTTTTKASGVSAVQQASVQQASAQVSVQASVSSGMPSCDQGDCFVCQDCTMQSGGPCEGPRVACETNPECAAFIDCISACPEDNPQTMNDEFLDCVCTTDGQGGCDPMSAPGTCIGDHPNGVGDYFDLANCVYDSCQFSCG